MDAHVSRSLVSGTARAPPSKSYTHRALLAAGYGNTTSVDTPLISADTRATARAVESFGGTVSEVDQSLVVEGFNGHPAVPDDVIDCQNSGTTMRLTTATSALVDGLTVLTGDASLRSRPQGPLLAALTDLDVRAQSTRHNGQAPLVIEGPMSGGEVTIPGDVSSQYVTALLMAGAVSEEGVEISLSTELKSAPYVDITLELLDSFGIDASPVGADTALGATGFVVAGGQQYHPDGGHYEVPGDFSSISYLLAAGAIAADTDGIRVEGARPSAQGDDAIVDILEQMDARIEWDRPDGVITVEQSPLSGTDVSAANTPDLLPTIAVLGAVADGDTRIQDCEHVRYKETDRVAAMATALKRMGASVTETDDTLTVHGDASELTGAKVDGRGDHRLVMALTAAGLAADGTTTILGAEHVDVSFPGFFDIFSSLGAAVETEHRP